MIDDSNNVVSLRKVKKRRAEQKTLCGAGFHKWKTVAHARFDVRQGKLITPERCTRCGAERVKAL